MASPRNKRKRKRGKGRLGPLFKLLCAGAVAVALTMGATVFFQVETVAVTGNSRYSQEEIIKATGIQTGDNLFRMNKFQIAHQVLQGLPYVEEITIRRSLPSTIVITVKEWDAVARVEAPGTSTAAAVQTVAQTPAEPAQPASGDKSAAGDSSGDSSAKDDQESAKPATQAWLISVGGKLLEPAPADSTAISVTGITPLSPRAGKMLVLSQEEQPKLTALLALLQGLEDHDMLADTASIALGDTHVELRYLDRFTVKLPLTGDLDYKLQALKAAVPEAEKKLGEQTTGTFDLTQESITAVYTPD